MTRAFLDYRERRATPAVHGFDPDAPIAGHYRMRLRSGAVQSPIRIWFGPPHDPVTGEEMDRSHRWQATVNGRAIELDAVWPKCADAPIDADEHAYLIARLSWAEQHAPASPQANPMQRIDPLTAPTPF